MQFTNKNVVFATPGRHQVVGTKGLYLYVTPDSQVRRWILRYVSPITHRTTETGLGLFPAVSLNDAREKVGDLRKQIANGICPIAAKRTSRASQVTFKEACDGWIATNKPSWRSESQMRNCNTLLFRHGHALGKVSVASITPDMIQSALEKLWARHPAQARRTLGMFERVLDYAKAKGYRSGDNPASWRGMFEYRFPRQRKIDRGHYTAMPYEKIPGFIQELRQRQERSTGAVALEFVILTACRKGEALGMTWDEIDWDKKLWTLPPERTKQGRQHQVPLSDRAVALLEQQKQYRNGSEFIFTGYKRTKMAERNMMGVLQHMGLKSTVHGFRSTFRDWCGNETNFAREPVEHCLAHQCGNAVEQAYRRQDGLNKRRVIMQTWADYCTGKFLFK
jgi:integrase